MTLQKPPFSLVIEPLPDRWPCEGATTYVLTHHKETGQHLNLPNHCNINVYAKTVRICYLYRGSSGWLSQYFALLKDALKKLFADVGEMPNFH